MDPFLRVPKLFKSMLWMMQLSLYRYLRTQFLCHCILRRLKNKFLLKMDLVFKTSLMKILEMKKKREKFQRLELAKLRLAMFQEYQSLSMYRK